MTPFRIVTAGFALLAAFAAAPASAEGWTGWSDFHRSFAVEPPPAVSPAKLPGIHKVPDVTLKRGVMGTTPPASPAPKPKSSLEVHPSPLDDMPTPSAETPRKAASGPATSAAIRRPALDDRKYTDLVDDMNRPASAPKTLAPKTNLNVPGTGSPFSGTYRVANKTHALHRSR